MNSGNNPAAKPTRRSGNKERKPTRSAIKRARNVAAKPRGARRFEAVQNNARISPRKVGLVTAVIRGKRVEEALNVLAFDNRRASGMVRKVLQSAVANASNLAGLDPMDLKVTHAVADEGFTFKRWQARGRGRAGSITRRNTHITVAVA